MLGITQNPCFDLPRHSEVIYESIQPLVQQMYLTPAPHHMNCAWNAAYKWLCPAIWHEKWSLFNAIFITWNYYQRGDSGLIQEKLDTFLNKASHTVFLANWLTILMLNYTMFVSETQGKKHSVPKLTRQ